MPEELYWALDELDIEDLDLSDERDLIEFEGYLADCISNETGYYIFDFDYEILDNKVRIFDIEYCTDDEEN